MIDVKQFNDYVVEPALKHIGLYTPAAAELVLGTAIQESGLKYLHQLKKGPALGLFQMEPATFVDIWHNYLVYREELAKKVTQLGHNLAPDAMITDLLFAAAMCRVHYRRVDAPLPEQGDYEAQAAYWKEHYNTIYGAGTEEEYLEHWHAAMGTSI